MNLSAEDSLRLNVLVTNAEAVRIDENAMAVYGLQAGRELKVQLNPTCNGDKYLGYVRELLSGAVLDSPGGYPVFLRRWTRMGQIDHDQLDRLLRLGEPEAVMAVVCSPGLTDDLARRAWWAAPSAEHARRMLEHPRVAQGVMGPVLAEYLIEYLPFETEHRDMLESVRLVLQPGLITPERRQRLWEAGRSKKTYRVGFLRAVPDELPEPLPARRDAVEYTASLAAVDVPASLLLRKLLDGMGQTFLDVAADALRRPADQDVVTALLDAIGDYFRDLRSGAAGLRTVAAMEQRVAERMADPHDMVAPLLAAVPALRAELEAMLFLAEVSESAVTEIFARSDAVGSVMRARIEPVVKPILARMAILRGAA
ncbi:MAG: sulfur reduction protein DsrS [Thiohalomonadaceae bacterium]